MDRKTNGKISYHSGIAAEAAAIMAYRSAGFDVLANRLRTDYGEIDLILRQNNVIVFAEVKAAKSHAVAATRITRAQARRIFSASEVFLAQTPADVVRYDAVLVDQQGRVDIVENGLADLMMI